MRFAVDAHAIGRHLTGNEVYVRSLLRGFAEVDRRSEFIAYISEPDAERWIPQAFRVRHVSANPYSRLGWDLARLIRDRSAGSDSRAVHGAAVRQHPDRCHGA